MLSIERHRFTILVVLSALTIFAFIGFKAGQPTLEQSALEQVETAGPCGTCIGQDGSSKTCNKASQKYTCTAQTQYCTSVCK